MQDVNCDGGSPQGKQPADSEGTEDDDPDRKGQNALYTFGLACAKLRKIFHARVAGCGSGKQGQKLQRALNQRELTVAGHPQIPALQDIQQEGEESSRQSESDLPAGA